MLVEGVEGEQNRGMCNHALKLLSLWGDCTFYFFVTNKQTSGCLISCTDDYPSGEEEFTIVPQYQCGLIVVSHRRRHNVSD